MTKQLRRALTWSFWGEVSTQALVPVVFLVLAQILVPDDFGIVTAALAVISFSQLFSDAGLASALVQRRGQEDESANAVFWLNLVFGLSVALLLIVLAPYIAIFFGDPRVTPLVRVLSLQVILTSLSSVHLALLQKSLNFKRLFLSRMVSGVIPGLASIPLAIYGANYWALVAGSLMGQLLQSILLWRLSPWRPRWKVSVKVALELLAFGKWAMLSGLLGWCYGWLDTIVVGHYLGSHEMGLYRTGHILVGIVFAIAISPSLPVMYSIFSRTQGDTPTLRGALETSIHGIAAISLPIALLLFWVRLPIENVFFGHRWEGIGTVIGLIAVAKGAAWLVGANGEVFRAIGKPRLEAFVMGASLLVYAFTFIVAIQYGMLIFLYVRIALVALAILPHMLLLRNAIGFSCVHLASALKLPIIALAIASGITILSDGIFPKSDTSTIISGFLGLLTYCYVMFVLDRPLIDILRGRANDVNQNAKT